MPLFEKTDAQKKLLNIADILAEDVLKPSASKIDELACFPEENFKAISSQGLYGLRIPKILGGLEADVLTSVLVIERLSRACGSTGMCFKMHCESTEPIWRLANNKILEKIVKEIADGEKLTTTAISEFGTGSHVWSLQSKVERKNANYSLSDVKKGWVTSSTHADIFFLPAMLDNAEKGHFTSFVLDRKNIKCTIDSPWKGFGMKGNASSPMTFSGNVSEKNRLGSESAWQTEVAKFFMPFSMITFAAVYLGIAEGAYEECLNHLSGRIYGDEGSKLLEIDGIQRYVGEMKIALDQTRAFIYSVAELIEKGETADVSPLIQAVCAADQTALFVTRTAMNLGGGRSYGGENSLGRYLRDAQAGSVMAPTDDMIKLRVGRLQLGQPQF